MSSRILYIFIIIILAIAYLGGLLLQIMDVDAAQYAAMAMEMLKSRSFLKLYDGGVPYLDKPPLHIWLAALSFSFFGIADFAYRIPSFLATLFAVYCTYCFARQWYNRTIATWAALILASCQAYFLMNQDVKTDNLLTAMAIFSVWQLSTYIRKSKPNNFIFGFMGIGLAMLAKGPIGFMVPVAALGSHLLLTRNWKGLINFRWLLGLPIVLLVLLPFLVGLYQQWGLYGIKFFFWIQSFGRITGASKWSNNSGPFYFVHTFIWAFLPWSFCCVISIYQSCKEIVKRRFTLNISQDGFTIGGFVLMFIALSLSRYKLPHYIFVLFPFAAIFTARWVNYFWQEKPIIFKWLTRIQAIVYALLCAGIIAVLWLVFEPVKFLVFIPVVLLSFSAVILSIRGKNALQKIIIPGVIIMASVNMGLNWDFYRNLIGYQSSNKIGQIMTAPAYKKIHFYYYCVHGCHSLNYYSRQIVGPIYPNTLNDTLSKYDIVLYADEGGRKQIINNGYKLLSNDKYDNMAMEDYSIQQLSFKFLSPATRPEVVGRTYLLHLAKIDQCCPNKIGR